jgi:hypothetical protein
MTTIVNLKRDKCEIRIDRKSIFGNPYVIGRDGTREEVIEKYRVWFYKKLKDSSFRDRVLALKDHILGCWCKPDDCHGNVIVEYLEGIPIKTKSESIDLTDFE